MVMQLEALKKILEVSVCAPSGHNFQPWRFVWDKNLKLLKIFNVPGADPTLYNFRQWGSYIAHGALIENINIASQPAGYQPHFSFFPEGKEENLVAEVSFSPHYGETDGLYSVIKSRATNRKPYQNNSLEPGDESRIKNSLHNFPGNGLLLVKDAKQKRQLAEFFALNERLLFENYHVHESLFPHLRWTREDEKRSGGIYIKTLELPAPVRALFKLFRYWPVASFLGKIGFSKIVAKQNAGLYSACAAVGLLTVSSQEPYQYLNLGRAFERLWLEATRLNMAVQPLDATLYLGQRILSGDTQYFSDDQVNYMSQALHDTAAIFAVAPQTMGLIFRIGYADKPSGRSGRKAISMEA